MERLFTYRGRVKHESDKSWLVDLDNHDEEVWLPKSECEWDGGSEFTVPQWLAEKKDLPSPRGPW